MKREENKIYIIKFLPAAKNDISESAKNIYDYTGHKESVKRFLDEIKTSVESLSDFPYSCAVFIPVRPLEHEVRLKTSGNYNIYFHVDELNKQVIIFRVMPAKKNL